MIRADILWGSEMKGFTGSHGFLIHLFAQQHRQVKAFRIGRWPGLGMLLELPGADVWGRVGLEKRPRFEEVFLRL